MSLKQNRIMYTGRRNMQKNKQNLFSDDFSATLRSLPFTVTMHWHQQRYPMAF